MLSILLDYLFDASIGQIYPHFWHTEVKIVADISDLGYTEVKINVN